MSPQSGVGPGLAAVVVAYALAAALPAVLAWYATRTQPDSPTARAFAAAMIGIAVWGAAYFVRLFAPEWAVFWLTVLAFVGVTTAPVAVLVFALQYTDHEQYATPGIVGLLLVVPLVSLVLLATTRSHGLFYTSFEVIHIGPLTTSYGEDGPWFLIHTAYSFGALAVASVLLVAFGARQRRAYRRQAVFLVLAVAVAWSTNVAYLAGLTPYPRLDLTPVGLAVGGVFLALAVFRARLIDVTPVARDAVLEALDDVVIVVEGGRVADVNAAADRLLGPGDPIGKPAAAVLPTPLAETLRGAADPEGGEHGDESDHDDPADAERDGATSWLEDSLTAGEHTREDGGDRFVELEPPDRHRTYRLRTLPLSRLRNSRPDGGSGTVPEPPALTPETAGDGPRATVILLSDVTAQREHLRQLRKQNERLEEFAAAAAHDLRNPLNVIDGYVELARENPKPEYFDRIEQAADRMSRLVEDLLSLGRRGRLVESVVQVSLESAAERAWNSIDAEHATLRVEPGDPVPADGDRLVQLLENLLDNAVRHGLGDEEPVTITVGRMPDGFYVADDGPGIPAADRERVFEYGFTTREAGSGFGLAIVETVADAHGWDVRVTESEGGGARFEVTGVDRFDRSAGLEQVV